MRALPLVPWALVLVSACGTPAQGPGPAPASVPALRVDPETPMESVVRESLPAAEEQPEALTAEGQLGWSAGRPIRVVDLLVEWHSSDPNSLWLVLEKLVTARLATAEAQRLELSLPQELLALRFDREMQRLQELLEAEGLSLALYAREEYGQRPEVFTQSLRSAIARQMLVERVTRAWVLSNPWLRLRMIVVEGAEAMQALQGRLAAGEDFASLARELSLGGSAAQGGLVPFLVREEESPLSRRAFSQELGVLGEPFLHKGLQVLVRVEERHLEALPATWAKLESRVEASLLEHPLSDSEFSHWKLNMEQRYPIDVTRLLELLSVESAE